MRRRNRLLYFCLIIFAIILGLSSRKLSGLLPPFIAEYSGDTLWALMVFFIFGFIFKNYSTFRIALLTLIFSFAIELSQLFQADWINILRNTTPGGLILGYGFLWSDLLCYTAGTTIGVILDTLFSNSISD